MSDDDFSPWDGPGEPPEYDPTELERLLKLGVANTAVHGPMFRALMAARVWFFVPPHPELMSHMRDETEPLTWCSYQDEHGTFVPVFTSLEAEEKRAATLQGQEPMLAETEARVLLAHLASAKSTVLIIASNGTTVRFPPETLASLVAGKLTGADPAGGAKENLTLPPLVPESLPEEFLQGIREFCAQRQGVISVHVFHPIDDETGKPNAREFRIILRLRDNAGHFYNDFCLVLEQTLSKEFARAVGVIEPDDEDGMKFLARCTPVWPVV